ncbi:hypothetical protein [Terrisporobacter petrolearius]|uniref:hypothetical protein n=1 Tax=Terrisporobacter petrolearius TaxID=1460447 RepID=UPI003B0040A9
MKKRMKPKLIAFSLIICSMLNVSLTSIHADEISNTKTQVESTNPTTEDMIAYLGGGPSPSAAWTFKYSGSSYFTAYEIDKLSSKMQGVIGSSSYKRGQLAYTTSVAAVGFMGWSKATKALFAVTSAGYSIFGSSYFTMIQSSANKLAKAASSNKSQTLKYKVYWRPANKEQILIFY